MTDPNSIPDELHDPAVKRSPLRANEEKARHNRRVFVTSIVTIFVSIWTALLSHHHETQPAEPAEVVVFLASRRANTSNIIDTGQDDAAKALLAVNLAEKPDSADDLMLYGNTPILFLTAPCKG